MMRASSPPLPYARKGTFAECNGLRNAQAYGVRPVFVQRSTRAVGSPHGLPQRNAPNTRFTMSVDAPSGF
jgi:hypothetical protein